MSDILIEVRIPIADRNQWFCMGCCPLLMKHDAGVLCEWPDPRTGFIELKRDIYGSPKRHRRCLTYEKKWRKEHEGKEEAK